MLKMNHIKYLTPLQNLFIFELIKASIVYFAIYYGKWFIMKFPPGVLPFQVQSIINISKKFQLSCEHCLLIMLYKVAL